MAQKLIRGLYAVVALLAITVALFVVPMQKAYAASCPTGMAQGSDGCCPQSALDANKGTSNDGRCCPPNQQPDSAGDCQTSSDATLDCGAGAMSWVVCMGIQILQAAAQKVDSLIMNQLTVNTQNIFDTNCSGKSSSCNTTNAQAYYAAWNSFRILGTGIIVIAGLIMIAAQATGFEAIDAYTIRKVLPRLGIAVVGIQLSWPLMQIVINLFNVLGYDLRQIMYAPFANLPKTAGGGSISEYILGNPLTLIIAGGALWALYGPAIFTFLLTGFLAAVLALAVLVVRQIGIIVLVIMAPVAIACYVLPGTQKVWKLWTDNFLGLLMMFPIISVLIAAGHIMSAVARTGDTFEQIVSIIAYFIPYFLLPMAFKMATGFIGNISGMINDRGKGAFDRLRGFRQKGMASRHERRMNEQMSRGRIGDLYRRTATGLTVPGSGAFGVTRGGRARYGAYRQAHLQAHTAEALKNDNGRAAGDDEATRLAVQGLSGRQFVEAMQRDYGRSEAQANDALAMLERGFGAKMGSHAMQLAAFKARAGSSTAYSGDDIGTQMRFNEGARLINEGLMTEADATAAGKGNRARTDINGAGFSTQMGAFRAAAAAQRAGGPGMTLAQAQAHLDTTLQEADPGDMLAGNTRTITAMAPAMVRNLQTQLNAATRPDGTVDDTHEGLNRALAQIAGVQDNLNRTSPQKAGMFADMVNGQILMSPNGATPMGSTVRQLVERAASRPAGSAGVQTFLEVRKEYGSARNAAAAGVVGGAAAEHEEEP